MTLAIFAPAGDHAALRAHLDRLRRPVQAMLPGGASSAAAWCADHGSPNMLLVDIGSESHPLPALLALAEQVGPGCRIITLGERDDVTLYRQLLKTGIFDYLLKPVAFDVLADTLVRADQDQLLGQGGRARVGRTIAVTGSAGGLGVSTLVAALGLWFAETRLTPTVLVDYDRHKGDLPLILGLEADAGLSNLLNASEIDLRLMQRTLLTIATKDAGQRLQLLAQRPGIETPVPADRTLELGAALCQLFSICLWDLPSHQPSGAADVLANADIRMVLTELSVQGARNTNRLLTEIGDETTGQRLLLIASASRYGTRTVLNPRQFTEFVGRPIDLQLADGGTVLAESLLQGPLAAAASPVYAAAVARLGARILGTPEVHSSNGRLSAWLSRFGGRASRHSSSVRA